MLILQIMQKLAKDSSKINWIKLKKRKKTFEYFFPFIFIYMQFDLLYM